MSSLLPFTPSHIAVINDLGRDLTFSAIHFIFTAVYWGKKSVSPSGEMIRIPVRKLPSLTCLVSIEGRLARRRWAKPLMAGSVFSRNPSRFAQLMNLV